MGIVELVEESERERRVLWTTIYRAKIGEYREKIGRKKQEEEGEEAILWGPSRGLIWYHPLQHKMVKGKQTLCPNGKFSLF